MTEILSRMVKEILDNTEQTASRQYAFLSSFPFTQLWVSTKAREREANLLTLPFPLEISSVTHCEDSQGNVYESKIGTGSATWNLRYILMISRSMKGVITGKVTLEGQASK